MQNYTDSNSRSPPAPGGVITRAQTNVHNDTAQPALTSGFGSVMEKERHLQSAIETYLNDASTPNGGQRDRILRNQHSTLGANIALLEQRYESLPRPARFLAHPQHPFTTVARRGPAPHDGALADLIAQHSELVTDITMLIALAPDGQRGELILGEVCRNHEEMAWMLSALRNEDDTASRARQPEPKTLQPADAAYAHENWDNEGGHSSAPTKRT